LSLIIKSLRFMLLKLNSATYRKIRIGLEPH
jgi:hypothetical protein